MSTRSAPDRGSGATLYGVFVAVLLTALLGIAATVAFPTPEPYDRERWQTATLFRMVFCIAGSVVVVAAGLFLPTRIHFLRVGLMLAGAANLVVGNGFGWSYDHAPVRLLVAAVSLAVAVGAGLIQFLRPRRSDPSDTLTATGAASGDVEARLGALEERMAAAGAALWQDRRRDGDATQG